jgi:putative oxidoreductase
VNRQDYALLFLRIGFGLFFLIFGILKFVSSGPMTGAVYPGFWGGLAVPVLIYIIGVVQIIAGLLLLLGLFTVPTAVVVTLMHVGTTVVSFPRIVTPFTFPESGPPHFLFFSAVPILFALLALVLMGAGSFSLDARRKGP